ncbi:hypothetical protein KIPB_009848, partial [Kipferlia bialata]
YDGSAGTPSVAAAQADAPHTVRAVMKLLRGLHHTGQVFLMGRSMGSISALSAAVTIEAERCTHPSTDKSGGGTISIGPTDTHPSPTPSCEVSGIVLDSAVTSLHHLATLAAGGREADPFHDTTDHASKLKGLSMPGLWMHADRDQFFMVEDAREMCKASSVSLKVYQDANHNYIWPFHGETMLADIATFLGCEQE